VPARAARPAIQSDAGMPCEPAQCRDCRSVGSTENYPTRRAHDGRQRGRCTGLQAAALEHMTVWRFMSPPRALTLPTVACVACFLLRERCIGWARGPWQRRDAGGRDTSEPDERYGAEYRTLDFDDRRPAALPPLDDRQRCRQDGRRGPASRRRPAPRDDPDQPGGDGPRGSRARPSGIQRPRRSPRALQLLH
jgi:hypothetical protein